MNNLKLLKKLKKVEKECKKGDISPGFKNVKKAIAWLNSSNEKYSR